MALHWRRAWLWHLKDFSGEAHPPQNKIPVNAQVWKGQDSSWHHISQHLIAASSQEGCRDRGCLCFAAQHIYCLLTIPTSLKPPASCRISAGWDRVLPTTGTLQGSVKGLGRGCHGSHFDFPTEITLTTDFNHHRRDPASLSSLYTEENVPGESEIQIPPI